MLLSPGSQGQTQTMLSQCFLLQFSFACSRLSALSLTCPMVAQLKQQCQSLPARQLMTMTSINAQTLPIFLLSMQSSLGCILGAKGSRQSCLYNRC